MSASDRRTQLERAHPDLSIRRQCAMLGVARSGAYRTPRPVNDNDLEAMRRIDVLFTARPFYGARRIARTLTEDGFPIDRKRARRLMRRIGSRRWGRSRAPANPRPAIRSIPISCATFRSNGRTKSVMPMSRTFRSAAAFSIWSPSSTGRAERFFPGGCRTRWTRRSAWRRWRRRWPDTVSRRSSTPTRATSSPARISPAC
jgi:putative transposase